MANNEWELLSEEEIRTVIRNRKEEIFAKPDAWAGERFVAEAQIAKLKAIGWKSPEEVKELILDEHNQHADDVKWDREKVAIFLANEIADTYSQEHDFAFDILSMIEQNDFREYADQLYKELTGGKDGY